MKTTTRFRTNELLVLAKNPFRFVPLLVCTLLFAASLSLARAAELEASDGAAGDNFGFSIGIAGTTAIVGAYLDDDNGNDSGSGYLFGNLDTATGTVTQDVKLTASDGAASDFFGYSVGISGTTAIVGAYQDDDNGTDSGSAYIFRNLDTATGTVMQDVKLIASDGAVDDFFGRSVAISGTTAIVGAYLDDDNGSNSGSAYVFRNLDTATGTVTQDVKLTASDGAAGDRFGYSVGISGTAAIVGAEFDDDNGTFSGSAYVFRNLDTATGTVTQDVKLTASDGAASDFLGRSVGISGTTAIVGADGDDDNGSSSGSAYVFRNLDTAIGTVTQDAKLTASDGAALDQFGFSVAISGSNAIVGALGDDIGANSNQGSAYLFRNLNTATGTVTEDVKVTASDGAAFDDFGQSVAIDGDQFVIGAQRGNGAVSDSGTGYSGSVSSVTTLDEGNASRTIDRISFESRTDWIIGQTTDSNQVTLTSGDSGNVTAAGKAVYIGQEAGSDNNTLTIEGSLLANDIHIGATGNTGNKLLLGGTGDRINDSAAIHLNNGTFDTAGLSETVGALTLESTSIIDLGDLSSILRFADSSGESWSGTLSIYDWSGDFSGGGTDQLYFGTDSNGLTSAQLAQIAFYSDDGLGFLGYAQILSTGELVPVPEPSTVVAALLVFGALIWRERRRLREILSRLVARVGRPDFSTQL